MAIVDLILDTDIGDDVDDALALAFALQSPEVNLRAVTTVHGEVETRARLALKVLHTFGRDDVPVASGTAKPLFRPRPTHRPNQAVVLDSEEKLPAPWPGHAVDLIIETVMNSPGEVVICPVGAQTNLALALAKEPRLVEKARIVFMGGVFSRMQAEYNIACDPEAARLVVESGIPLTMVGLDVTLKCRLTTNQVDALGASDLPSARLLADLIAAWRGPRNITPTLHDPLAIAVTFDPSLVALEPRLLRVETQGAHTRGFTLATPSDQPNAQVCTDVEAERFVQLFFQRVSAPPARI
ncbi:MAG TPA: nucleoside hydrolase [Armatimonadetes bacterium]|nr:nucleoside hydrolase [Armatimonadota bacterium]